MNTSLLWKALILFLLSPTSLFSQIRNGTFVVRPKEIDDVRNNPGIGFTTFQRFNGDTLSELNNKLGWTELHPIVYQQFKGNLTNRQYPQTGIACWTVYWKYLEPEKGKYKFSIPMHPFTIATGTMKFAQNIFICIYINAGVYGV